MRKDKKKSERQAKHERLLRLFDGEGYEEFHTPKYIFVKQWNGNNNQWQVAIYTIDSWNRMQQYNEANNHIRQISLEEF